MRLKIILITIVCSSAGLSLRAGAASSLLRASEDTRGQKNLWAFDGTINDPQKVIGKVLSIASYNGRLYVGHNKPNVPIISQDTREVMGCVEDPGNIIEGGIVSFTLLPKSAIGYMCEYPDKVHKIKLANKFGEKDRIIYSMEVWIPSQLHASADESKIIFGGVLNNDSLRKIYILDTEHDTILAAIASSENLSISLSSDNAELWVRSSNYRGINNPRANDIVNVYKISEIGKKPVSEMVSVVHMPSGEMVSTLDGVKFYDMEFDALRNATLKIIDAKTQHEHRVPIRHDKKHRWSIRRVMHSGKYICLWEDNSDRINAEVIDWIIVDTQGGEVVHQMPRDHGREIIKSMVIDPLTEKIYARGNESGIDIFRMRTSAI